MTWFALFLISALDPSSFGPAGRFTLERSRDSFGERSHGIVENPGSGRTKFYPLPQSSARDYMRLRPEGYRLNPFPPETYEREEVIGPYQVERGGIWFGKSFYDGEGMRGVGAFGFFDTSTRKYTLFSPPAVAQHEITAILARPDEIWVALASFGEASSKSPGGIVRWDRATHAIRKYPLEFVVEKMRMKGESLLLTTAGGYAFLLDGKLSRFLENGKPIRKFPPPPSQY